MIQQCICPVAGYGTRFLPATKSTPKEMLPVVNKPLLQYGVEEALEARMSNCAFVTGRGKRAIADHFDISYELEHQISGTSKEKYLEGIRNVIENGVFTMVRQREMKGLGHAILTGEPLIGDQALVCFWLMICVSIRAVLACWRKCPSSTTSSAVPSSLSWKYRRIKSVLMA